MQFAVRSSCGPQFAAIADSETPDAHAIYLLNLLLAFLQPKFDPSIQDDIMADDMEEGGDVPTPLPSSRDDEFRPFVRRLPEWQFWLVWPHALLSTELLRILEAVDYEGHDHCDFLHPLHDFRCARLLAHSGHVFLCTALLDYEEANTVSPSALDAFCGLVADFSNFPPDT